jgi:hypothetical protein
MPPARDLTGAATLRTGAAGLAAVLVCGLGAACSPSDDSKPPGQETPDNAALTVTTAGPARMDDDLRARMEAEVSDLLARYVVQGFLGDYPRQGFVDGLADFSSRATKYAAADIDVLTGSNFERATGVRATALDAELHFLVRGQVVVGASAYVDFDFEVAEDDEASTASLSGRLTLGRSDDGWQVYGYDVVRDDSDALPAEATS